MRRLNINFAPKRQLPTWVWHSAAALLFAVALQQTGFAWKLKEQTASIDAQVASLRNKRKMTEQQRREAEAKAQQIAPYARDAAELVRVASYPIEAVLGSLEALQISGIKLTALDISPRERAARAEVEFNDTSALLHYMEALNDGTALGRWSLMQVQPAKDGVAKGTARLAATSP